MDLQTPIPCPGLIDLSAETTASQSSPLHAYPGYKEIIGHVPSMRTRRASLRTLQVEKRTSTEKMKVHIWGLLPSEMANREMED